eukprot:680773-Hanusia_phi.AAC.1
MRRGGGRGDRCRRGQGGGVDRDGMWELRRECEQLKEKSEILARSKALLQKSMLEQVSSLRDEVRRGERRRGGGEGGRGKEGSGQ